jgi:hypothetical protein
MIFLISLLPATILAVIGYFVLFASARAEGGLNRFGKYLGGWLILLAGLSALSGLLASTFGVEGRLAGVIGEMGQHMDKMEQLEEEQTTILRDLKPN